MLSVGVGDFFDCDLHTKRFSHALIPFVMRNIVVKTNGTNVVVELIII